MFYTQILLPMYDTTDMYYYKAQSPSINFIEAIPQYLTHVSNEGESEFGEYINGYINTLSVSVTKNRIKITGSLCKFYLGDNFKSLTKGDTKRAIEKISDYLHLPINDAHVTRLDIAQNLIMKLPVDDYYKYLGEVQYYKRLEQSNGLYYNNQLRQMVFYGKEYEQRVKKQHIPELYKYRNVLRFELRFLKRLSEQFKLPEITANLLYDEVFYSELVKRWKNEYLAIQKINSSLTSINPTSSTKELIENMALIALLDIGQPKILSTVKEWQNKGLINKKQAADHRKKIKLLSNIPINENGNELITELNKKIKETARCW